MNRVLILFIVLMLGLAGTCYGQWIYLSWHAGDCSTPLGHSIFDVGWQIYVHAPLTGDVSGASFRLEAAELGLEDGMAIVPAAGVTISGNLLQGLDVSWSPRELKHTSIFTVLFTSNPPVAPVPDYYMATTRDGYLHLADGTSLALEDVNTEIVHCQGGGADLWQLPEVALVVAGMSNVVEFKGIATGSGQGAVFRDITATDERGWVSGLTPKALWGYCGLCPWRWSTFQMIVDVPPEVPDSTESLVTLWEAGWFKLTEFTIRAVQPVPVEQTTWGRVKSIFRR